MFVNSFTHRKMFALLAPHGVFDGGHGDWIPNRKQDGPQLLRFVVVVVFLAIVIVVVTVAVQNHLVGIHELFGPPVHLVEADSLEQGHRRVLLSLLQECL